MASDPSQGTGRRDKVAPNGAGLGGSRGWRALDRGPSRSRQSFVRWRSVIYPERFFKLMDELRLITPAVGRKITRSSRSARQMTGLFRERALLPSFLLQCRAGWLPLIRQQLLCGI
jgi:hypothetical protein